jgi:acetyl esterase/lipase
MADERFGLSEAERELAKSDDVDVAWMRSIVDEMGGRFPGGVTSNVVSAGGVRAELISSNTGMTDRVLCYLHGGGYIAGSLDSHRNLTGHLAVTTSMQVLTLDYRLAPEHPHPAAVKDSVAGYRWLLEEGYEPGHVVIAGDSAGGGLTMATLLALKAQELPLPAASVVMSPWVDMEAVGESMQTRAAVDPVGRGLMLRMAELFLDGADPTDPLAAPLHGDLSGLPPLLIQVGDAEVLLDDSTRLAAKAEQAGVEVTLEVWDEMTHVFQNSVGSLPEADEAVARIAQFSRRHVGL